MCDGPSAGFPRRATLAALKGEWPYTEEAPSGAAPTSPSEGVFRHKRLMELDEQSGRTTGRLGYTWPTTAYTIGGTATLHHDTLSSLHLPPPALILSDDCGPPGAVG